MDLQCVLLSPRLQASALYYKTKLACHNFTLYDLATKDVTCYFWHEGEGDLTGNSFASCIVHFIEDMLAQSDKEIKTVVLYSDGCTYQNRNTVLANALSKLAKERGLTILQKYLEKGHTQMEVDSVHSTIESKLKRKPIYVPQNYVDIIKSVRPSQPYHVHYVDHTFFKNFSHINLYSSIRPGTKVGDPVVTDIRVLEYSPHCGIRYKLMYDQEFCDFPRKAKLNEQATPEMTVAPLHATQCKVKESKYKHLQELKNVIPRDFHPFYDLYSATKIIEPGQEYRDTFTVDTSIHGDLSFTATYKRTIPILKVTSPSQKQYNELSSATEINHDLMMIRLKFQHNDAEVGKWKFSLRGRRSQSTVTVVVFSNSTARDGNVPITLKARLVLNNNSVPPKMAAYADVTKGHHPVIGLNVIATVYRPGDEDGGHTPPHKMALFDRGSGADILKDDGIYSRYFPHLTGRGHYLLTVDILDSDGSVVTQWTDGTYEEDRINTNNISRSAHGGSVYLHTNLAQDPTWKTSASDGVDVYPPSRIIDLHVVRKSDVNMTVTLSCTAPGGDLDHGKAAKYDIRYEQSGLDLLKLKANAPSVPDVAILTGNTTNPLPAGNTEYFTINVTDLFLTKNKGFAFLIRGIDEFGNKGDFSNMVTVGFNSLPETIEDSHVTSPYTELDMSETALHEDDSPHSKAVLQPLLFLNAVLLSCFILIGVGFVSVFYQHRFVKPEVLLS
ncbi:calcium-activated chloride channel regulator 4A-like [Ylistrum balloti]|uniref:calcium-activated chloride channel regulator 4A-like n=1 Tax=Ylistrum balloti TaxID=509963 RepID=UPI002905B666|nr:calcium-activated chloride channel regulator 4A-like [Ylistrum balloti]